MIAMKHWSRTLAAAAILLSTVAASAIAQDDEQELGWAFEADLGSLWTGGNQETFTLAVDATAHYVWPKSRLKLVGGGFSTESSLTTTTAIGTGPSDFQLLEETVTEKTAETFYTGARYDYDITEKLYLFGGGDWMRNIFSGIESQFRFAVGAGNLWADNDRVRFSTDYAFTYTLEDNVVESPGQKSDFPGLRFGYDLNWFLTTSTTFESSLAANWNLDNTDDIRVNWYAGLPVDISSVLALKPSLRLMWRNDPALQDVPLLDAPGGTQTGTVLTPLKELDTYFNIALVFKF